MRSDVIGRVLHVSAGKASPLIVHGETLSSGFDKVPLHGRIAVTVDGLAPDEHVDDAQDRDRALLIYQRGHYEQWNRELGRDLPPGTFGENLTVEAPPDAEFAVGDELRIGTARLRVTQPRIPCRKMAVRLQEGDDFPNRYLLSGRLGFFCSVVEEGEVGAGDTVELLSRGAGQVSVAEVAQTLHFASGEVERLQRLVTLPALPAGLKAKAKSLLTRAAGHASGWAADRPLLVTARRDEARDVVSVELDDPDGRRLPGYDAGQFLTLSFLVEGRERPAQRSYTIVSRSSSGAGYRIAVKRVRAPHDDDTAVPDGLVSGLVHETLLPGTLVMARRPMGQFVVEPGSRPVVLVSAGIGITPMLAMLRQLADCPPPRDVYFLHGARSGPEHAFADEVRQLAAALPRARVHVAYSRPADDDAADGRFDTSGRLSPDLLAQELPTLAADFYLCGPPDFIRALDRGLSQRGVPSDRIRYEYFGTAPATTGGSEDGDAVLGPDGLPITVTFARSGASMPWTENMHSVLALAERAGLRPDASCRTGLCATCVSTVISGSIEYPMPPLQRPADGEALICCARPATSVVLDL